MISAQDTNPQVRHHLREFVEENLLSLHPDLVVADDDRLLELGVIDSLGFVELVEEVQSRFGIEVGDIEITEENFGSIAAIGAFVERKLSG
jgi:acyl carrier protein